MSNPISTHNLSKAFRRTEAVNALDLEVPEGSIYALIGPNGAGKTTTIKLLMNILRASAGYAEVLGVDSRRLSPREFARIGYVSENQEMPEWMTVDYLPALPAAVLPDVGRRACRRSGAPVRVAARPQAAPPLARHADESGAGFVAGLPSRTGGAGRAVHRPRRAGARRVHQEPAGARRGHHHSDLLARPGRDRELRQPRGLHRRGPSAIHRRDGHAGRPLPPGGDHLRCAAAAARATGPPRGCGPRPRPPCCASSTAVSTPSAPPRKSAALFPGARNVEFHAMSLREIFVALALAGRHAKAA